MSNLPVLFAVGIAFAITAISGFWMIPLLRKLKYGQTILDIGPHWHKKKQGIPTMGGILFAVGITVAVLTGFAMLEQGAGGVLYTHSVLDNTRILLGLAMALAFGFVGFLDDFIKVGKRRNLGLTARQKLVMQLAIAGLYVLSLYLAGDRSTMVAVPFLGSVQLGIWYYPIAIVGIAYLVNCVNLTDGVDGLCSSVTFVVALGFLGIAGVLQMEGMSMMAGALAGGCLGFLVWNFHPAKIFMGDTGSLFLGGMVVALAFGLRIPAFLIFLGLVYILEGLSVMVQTTYFKLTRRKYGEGRRLFKMSPIHHHYEMSGWSEVKVGVVFALVQLIACALAMIAAMEM